MWVQVLPLPLKIFGELAESGLLHHGANVTVFGSTGSNPVLSSNMVSVAQLVEPWFVEPAVASSSLVGYPIIADSPSGKAEDSDSSIRKFESFIGN